MSIKTAAGKATAPSHLTNNRRPVGTPGAGEWIPTARREADLELGVDPQAEKDARNAAYAAKRAEMNELLAQYTDPETLNRQVMEAAEVFVRRYNQDQKSNHVGTQDIAQESIEHLLAMLERGVEINNFNQFIPSLVANRTVRATENKFRAENRRAYRIWAQKCDDKRLETGRSLTRTEEDTLAQEVLDEWQDLRHKPSKDFRTPHTVDTSLDAPLGEDDFNLGMTLMAEEYTGNNIAPDSFMDKAFTAVEKVGSANKAEAKRLMFNALAESAEDGVPLAREGSLSQRQVTKHRTAMKETGVLSACEDWGDMKENAAVTALFAPFGDLDSKGQTEVVAFLQSREAYAEHLWASAIAFANNKHASS